MEIPKLAVLKVGSSLLVDQKTFHSRISWLQSLAEDVRWLCEIDTKVIIVTSGAIATARGVLGLDGVLDIATKQALAAVGQVYVMENYKTVFKELGMHVAQILLDKDDTISINRRQNVCNTINRLLEMGIVPVVNENDSLAVDEIKIGDNDTLSALVAGITNADTLVLLSDIDGLFDSNPKLNPNARFIESVAHITPEIERMASGSDSAVGTGGMLTKIAAAKIAKNYKIQTIITNGTPLNPIRGLFNNLTRKKRFF